MRGSRLRSGCRPSVRSSTISPVRPITRPPVSTRGGGWFLLLAMRSMGLARAGPPYSGFGVDSSLLHSAGSPLLGGFASDL